MVTASLTFGLPVATPNVASMAGFSEHINTSNKLADFAHEEVVAIDADGEKNTSNLIDVTGSDTNNEILRWDVESTCQQRTRDDISCFVCDGADPLDLDKTYHVSTPSTVHSSFPLVLPQKNVRNLGSCVYDFAFEPDELGLWFRVTGITTGDMLEATTSSFNDIFKAELLVFTGTSCDQLDCVASGREAVQWDSVADTDFYILVHGWNNEVRDFEINIREGEVQSNDICNGAIELDPKNNDEVFAYNTYFATPESNIDEDFCDIYSDEIGVWFLVKGTGKPIEASTCNHITDFDTKISVMSGTSCDDEMECVASNDDDAGCGEQSTVVWESTINVNYYILVRGPSLHDIGSFGISLREVAVGNDCDNEVEDDETNEQESNDTIGSYDGARLLELQTNSEIYISNNYLAKSLTGMEEEYCGVFSDEIGVWFRVIGTGNTIEASTCNDVTNFDANISVFYGSSFDELVCVVSNEDSPGCGEQSSVIWDSILNVVYYILVHSEFDDYGEIGITVREVLTSIES